MRIQLFTLVALMWGAASPETLVVRGPNGEFQPGAAKRWWADGSDVHLELTSPEKAAAVAKQLEMSLAGAQITTRLDVITITGVPTEVLLEQLSRLSLDDGSGDPSTDDPLAALADAGFGSVAFSVPEGGGSIRATNFALPNGALPEVDSKERFVAEVVSVDRQVFPRTILRLRVISRAEKTATRRAFRRNTLFNAPVLLGGNETAIDFSDPRTQQNLVAYYLRPGDRLVIHTLRDERNRPHIDWLERR